MSVSNCGCDENGRYSGGQAGDQTGKEWNIINWYRYNGGWEMVLRHPDSKVGNLLADLATQAAKNDNIGYDQSQRGTFYDALKSASWKPSNIKTKCEADCSSGVAAIVIAAGFLLGIDKLKNVSKACTTRSLKEALKNAGFTILNADQYLTSDKYLLPGDILLKQGYHTCINLSKGSSASSSSSSSSSSSNSTSSSVKKSVTEVAKDVINGRYGNGQARKNALTKAGYDYATVQAEVDRLLGKTTSTSSASYYKACNCKSIVDGLKSIGVDSSFATREKIAKANGISKYSGSAAQNTKLCNLLKEGKLKKA